MSELADDDAVARCHPGTFKLLAPSGTSRDFLQCVNGSWVKRSCGPGTMAYHNPANGEIYCDFPRSSDDD